ncbi:Transcription regulator protein BACH2 [Manis javanica]|nr:Transcription regulator protein BACH2 [Manis javanica]
MRRPQSPHWRCLAARRTAAGPPRSRLATARSVSGEVASVMNTDPSGELRSPADEKLIREEFQVARRSFLRDAMVVGGGAVSAGAISGAMAPSRPLPRGAWGPGRPGMASHYYIPASASTVLWGYFSRSAKPVVEVESGDYVTMETLTHHANDDAERMVRGDPGAESVFHWDSQRKNVDRRGAGPMDAKNGAGAGQGVHICTGPVRIKGAQPGDVLEVRIIDVVPRPSGNPQFKGRPFGSNAAANWGFHYGDTLTEPRKREVVTIYELVLHKKADLPGTPLAELAYPPLETQDEWLLHGFSYANYLAELGPDGKTRSSRSFRDRAARRLSQDAPLPHDHPGAGEDEAISLMSIAVDFGITQVVDGNWACTRS